MTIKALQAAAGIHGGLIQLGDLPTWWTADELLSAMQARLTKQHHE